MNHRDKQKRENRRRIDLQFDTGINTEHFTDAEIETKEYDTDFIPNINYDTQSYYNDNYSSKTQSQLQRQIGVMRNFNNTSALQGDLNKKNTQHYQDYDVYEQVRKNIAKEQVIDHQPGPYFMTFNAADFIDNRNEFKPHINEIEDVPDKYNNAISRRKREITEDEPALRRIRKAQIHMMKIDDRVNDNKEIGDQLDTIYYPTHAYDGQKQYQHQIAALVEKGRAYNINTTQKNLLSEYASNSNPTTDIHQL